MARSENEKVDQQSKDSFPASDPPASSGIVGPRGSSHPGASPEKDEPEAKPKGRPTDDRHDTETAHHSESQR